MNVDYATGEMTGQERPEVPLQIITPNDEAKRMAGDFMDSMFDRIQYSSTTDDEMFAGLDNRTVARLQVKIKNAPDLRPLLCGAAEYRKAHQRPERAPSSARRVYFIQAQHSGLIKIGSAASPRQRLQTLQTGSPEPLVLLGDVPGGGRRERELHRKFADDRSHGEWFTPSSALTDFISEEL